MKLYGLMAYGYSALYRCREHFPSRRLFPTRDGAESDREDFTERAINPTHRDLDCLTLDSLEIEVVEYEMIEEPVLP